LRADHHFGGKSDDVAKQDCIHYCLSGPPDLSTVLIHHMLLEPGWMPLHLQAPLMSKLWARPAVLGTPCQERSLRRVGRSYNRVSTLRLNELNGVGISAVLSRSLLRLATDCVADI